MRPASQRFFMQSCIYLRIFVISYLATFLGTNSLSVLMCRKAVYQSIKTPIPQPPPVATLLKWASDQQSYDCMITPLCRSVYVRTPVQPLTTELTIPVLYNYGIPQTICEREIKSLFVLTGICLIVRLFQAGKKQFC